MRPILYFKLAVQVCQSKLASWLMGKHVAAILVRTPHGMIAIDPTDRGVGRQLLLHGRYAADETDRLLAHVSDTDDVLVVGAHVGALTLALARRARSVVAVEPNPRSFELLQVTVTLNGRDNCELHNVAASDRPGTLAMLISTANSGGSKRIPQNQKMAYSYDAPQRISVPAVRLDDILNQRKFRLVVMDIEGSEVFALRGMPAILSSVATLAVEFLPHHLRDVSAVTVEQFLQPITPHFTKLFIPSKNLSIGREEFLAVLTRMYERDEGDDGLLFSK